MQIIQSSATNGAVLAAPGEISGSPDGRWLGLVASLANYLGNTIIPSHPNGFTFCPRSWSILPDGPGTDPELYAVSAAGHEATFPGAPDSKQILPWLAGRWSLFRWPGYYIGGWPYKSFYYLDVSNVLKGFALARSVAQFNRQRGIYHFASCQTIFVGDEVIQPQGPLEPLAPAVS